jgi:hypothetical protein
MFFGKKGKEGSSPLRKVKIVLAIIVLAGMGLFLFYNLPRTAVVQISGTDVKRVDQKSGKAVDDKRLQDQGRGGRNTIDVRYINSLTRKGKTLVFRNEDTGWGWPPYFKFNSADLTAQAKAYASAPEKPWVLVKYYGWRIQIFSMFPNAVRLRTVSKDYQHFPLFNIVFIVLLLVAVFVIRRKIKGWLKRRRPEKP